MKKRITIMPALITALVFACSSGSASIDDFYDHMTRIKEGTAAYTITTVETGTMAPAEGYDPEFADILLEATLKPADPDEIPEGEYVVLDLPEEQDPDGKAETPVRGRVELRHVDFSYDPEKPLIRDLNMDIQPGQKVAIVGPTGAGKTTIVNLLMRFYDISAGQILIDGRDVSGMSRAENRDLFAMVLQDTWLFKGTVAENVAYGSPGATREEIEKACDCAYCDHFIRRLPQGYDTVISEDSTAVSSGQKQLLTIARALLANRPLLILDEATSNVDTRTELLIQKAMDRLMGGRTCFVIAHRLSTIVDADLILVLRDGRIVEQGTHRSLLEQKGFYEELFRSQYAV